MRNGSVVKERMKLRSWYWRSKRGKFGASSQPASGQRRPVWVFGKSWTIPALDALCVLAGNTSWLLILQTQIVDVWNGIHLLCLALWQPNVEVFQKEIPSIVECPRKVGWIGKWKALGATGSAQLCKQIDCYKYRYLTSKLSCRSGS